MIQLHSSNHVINWHRSQTITMPNDVRHTLDILTLLIWTHTATYEFMSNDNRELGGPDQVTINCCYSKAVESVARMDSPCRFSQMVCGSQANKCFLWTTKLQNRQSRVRWSHKTDRHLFSGLFSRTTLVRSYKKGLTNLDFNEARDDGVAVASAGPHANHLHLAPGR